MTPDTLPASDRAEWLRAAADQQPDDPPMTRAEAERDAAILDGHVVDGTWPADPWWGSA